MKEKNVWIKQGVIADQFDIRKQTFQLIRKLK